MVRETMISQKENGRERERERERGGSGGDSRESGTVAYQWIEVYL